MHNQTVQVWNAHCFFKNIEHRILLSRQVSDNLSGSNVDNPEWGKIVSQMKSKIILLTLTLLSAGILNAEDKISVRGPDTYAPPQLTEKSGLDDYLLYAMANNPGLKTSYLRWKAAVQTISQAGALPEPRLGYGYFLRQVETRVGPQVQRFGISQVFPWFGKLSLAESRSARIARAAAREFEADRLKLFRQVQAAYYDYWFLGRRIEVIKVNRELLMQTEAIVRNRYSTGLSPFNQVLKLQVETAKLEDMIATLEDLVDSQAASFNALLGRDLNLPLSFPVSIDTVFNISSFDSMRDELVNNNPSLSSIRELQKAAEDGVELAKKQRYPNLMFGLDYIQTDPSPMPGVTDNGKDPLIASVSINLPLSFGKYRAAEQEAISNLDALHSREENLSLSLQAALKKAQIEFYDQRRKLELYRNTLVPKAEQVVQTSMSSLVAGDADALDVLDAQRTLLSFQLEAERSIAELAKVSATIDELTGGALYTDRISSISTNNGN